MDDFSLRTRAINRGFLRTSFLDANGVECSLQESSAAQDEGLIWFGVDDVIPRVLVPGRGWKDVEMPYPNGDLRLLKSGRMHLTQSQVRDLLPSLVYFAEHGELPAVTGSEDDDQ
jgi:hypothetical protein